MMTDDEIIQSIFDDIVNGGRKPISLTKLSVYTNENKAKISSIIRNYTNIFKITNGVELGTDGYKILDFYNGDYAEYKKAQKTKINWSFIIPTLISFGLFLVSLRQCVYSENRDAEQNDNMNTIEQRVQDLEIKLEKIDTMDFCHSCKNR